MSCIQGSCNYLRERQHGVNFQFLLSGCFCTLETTAANICLSAGLCTVRRATPHCDIGILCAASPILSRLSALTSSDGGGNYGIKVEKYLLELENSSSLIMKY